MLAERSREAASLVLFVKVLLLVGCQLVGSPKPAMQAAPAPPQDPKLVLEAGPEEIVPATVKFRDPVKAGSGINTEHNEYYPYLSPNGNTLYFSSDRPGGIGAEDLYVAERMNGVWQKPKNLGPVVNSPAKDTGPMLSYGGTYLFFWSEREMFPRSRLFVSRIADGKYQPPVPLPEFINAAIHTDDPFLSADGKTLYFETCKRPGNFGKRDLWRSDIADGLFRPPVNLGRQINRFYRQKSPSLTADGRYLWFLTEHSRGDSRIFVSERVDGRFQELRQVHIDLPVPAPRGPPESGNEALGRPSGGDPDLVLGLSPTESLDDAYPFGYIDSLKVTWDGGAVYFSMKTASYDIWYAERR